MSPMNVSTVTTIRGNFTLSSGRLLRQYGYWGLPTSTVDWCEINYEHSHYIAEFWNTVSNILFVALGIYGLLRSMKQGFEWRFHMQFISVIVTGIGSALFHGTLQLGSQQCDETPMIWGILTWLYIVYDDEIRSTGVRQEYVVGLLTCVGVGFAILHGIYHFTLVFQLFFAILGFLCLFRLCAHYATVRDPRARAVARSFLLTTLGGFGCWMLDYHYCPQLRRLPVNPQGHAWWHLLSAIGAYHGPVFMQFVRAEQQKKAAEIVDAPFGLQTIRIHDVDGPCYHHPHPLGKNPLGKKTQKLL